MMIMKNKQSKANKPSSEVTIAVSNSIFTQIDQMKKLTGKTTLLESTIKTIEEEVKTYREEIAGQKKTLIETTSENTQQKFEKNKLNEK